MGNVYSVVDTIKPKYITSRLFASKTAKNMRHQNGHYIGSWFLRPTKVANADILCIQAR